MKQNDVQTFIKLYTEFVNKLNVILNLAYNCDLSFYDGFKIKDDNIILLLNDIGQTDQACGSDIIPINMLFTTIDEIKKYYIDEFIEKQNINIKDYEKSINIANKNIDKLEKINDSSEDLRCKIIKEKQKIIVYNSLIKDAKDRISRYINRVNNF
jgi:hypothetical protein